LFDLSATQNPSRRGDRPLGSFGARRKRSARRTHGAGIGAVALHNVDEAGAPVCDGQKLLAQLAELP
jgi:hypothetical protein